MTKIILVDDEPIFINALKKLVNWQDESFQVVYEAFNGVEAFDFAVKNDFDIIITDIKMPEMDGLTLIRKLSEIKSGIRIVVLSSYDEFHLVREAFKIGASEYILKTELNPETIKDICCKLRDEIIHEKSLQLEAENQKKALEKTSSYQMKFTKEINLERYSIINRIFRDILRGNLTDEKEIAERLSVVGTSINGNIYILADLLIHDANEIINSSWKENKDLFMHCVLDVFDGTAMEHNQINCFSIDYGEYAILISFSNAPDYKSALKTAYNICDRMLGSLKSKLNCEATVGISPAEKSISCLPVMYEQAHKAMNLCYVSGKGRIFLYEETSSFPFTREVDISNKVQYLKNVLGTLNTKDIADSIPILRVQKSDINLNQLVTVRKLFEKYTVVITYFLEDNGLIEDFSGLLQTYNEKLWKSGSLPELNIWLSEILTLIASKFEKGNSIVSNACKLIQSHYNNDISLSLVADAVNVSYVYLSKLFTAELGCTFSEYVNRIRIEKAKDLIKSTDLKIYQISGNVGYKNEEHFSRVFKKITGNSPKEYLKKCRNFSSDLTQ